MHYMADKTCKTFTTLLASFELTTQDHWNYNSRINCGNNKLQF